MATHHAHTEIRDPGPFKAPAALNTGLIALTVAGLAVLGVAFTMDPHRAWSSFVVNHFYFMSLALGGLFFAAIQWITGAMWSAPVRRIAESFTAFLPVTVVTLAVLFYGIHSIYEWSHPDHVRGDMVLESKAGYLSTVFFMIRNGLVLGLLIFFAKKMIGNSLKQDQQKGNHAFTMKNRTLAPGFLIVFALGYTMMSFDQIMSLDPHWFSTIFGVYCFAGLYYVTHAMIVLITIYLRRKGMLEGLVNENHLHDIGKFMFAFTIFWAYIGFSQFMLIWYANLPEETGYYILRLSGSWYYVSVFLLVGKFVFPFFWLLQRGVKRAEFNLLVAGTWMLFAQLVDVIWMVQPQFFKDGPHIGWIEIGSFLGFLGLFGLVVVRFLGKHSIVAVGDPRLEEAVHHHHQ